MQFNCYSTTPNTTHPCVSALACVIKQLVNNQYHLHVFIAFALTLIQDSKAYNCLQIPKQFEEYKTRWTAFINSSGQMDPTHLQRIYLSFKDTACNLSSLRLSWPDAIVNTKSHLHARKIKYLIQISGC